MLSKVCTYTYPLAGSSLCRSRRSRSCKCLYPLLQAPFVPTLRLHCREKVSFGCAHGLASSHWHTCIEENASLYEIQIHKIGGTAISETERENIKREKRRNAKIAKKSERKRRLKAEEAGRVLERSKERNWCVLGNRKNWADKWNG